MNNEEIRGLWAEALRLSQERRRREAESERRMNIIVTVGCIAYVVAVTAVSLAGAWR